MDTPGTPITLVYDNGVFRPQGPVPAIKNHAVVRVVVVDESGALGGEGTDRGVALTGLKDLVREEGDGTLNSEAVASAERFVAGIPDRFPMPEFAADPDGSVEMDWIVSRTRMFSVNIGADDRLAYAWLDGEAHGHGVECFVNGQVPPRILEGILRIVSGGGASLRAS